MAQSCLLYYITDRTQFTGDERDRRRALLAKIAEAARANVDYVQLREKDLVVRELEHLARECVEIIQQLRTENRELRTRLLINSRTDIALAAGAAGVHLRSDDLPASTARSIWVDAAGHDSRLAARSPIIAVSCHTSAEARRAEAEGADFAVFAPVFGKKDAPAATARGLSSLRAACTANIPVLALGCVTLNNADMCLAAGAAGIAGIRLFQDNKIEDVVRSLRGTQDARRTGPPSTGTNDRAD
ncbi:MAG: thiamine phosphate synthase [Terriglobales bacterium]